MSVQTIDFDAKWAEFQAAVEDEKALRRQPPKVYFFDGNWNLRGQVTRINSANVQLVDNETGTAEFELPLDYWMSEWVLDVKGRSTQNIHIVVDKDGARWSGRMEEFTVIKNDDGTGVLQMVFLHEYNELKHILCFPNPWLPPEVQFPRLWLLFGPARWALKTTLLVNIIRLYSSAWAIRPDPLNPNGWDSLDQSTWWIAVKPGSIDGDSSLPAIVHGRMKNMHEVSHKIVEDAQLSWEFRRYLPVLGDEPPWEGADLRNGCLVVDLVDKSGFTSGTAFEGNLFAGLIKAFINIDSDGLTEGVDLIQDPNAPGQYYDPDFMGTLPEAPWVIYRDGVHTGIQNSGFTYRPATVSGVVAGGHSMPGVNELISACCAGDTVINGPAGDERIDVLAEHGKPFWVWSVTPEGRRVPALASHAFRKGRAELFEYVLNDGKSVKVTHLHRFLSRDGWKQAVDLRVGDEIATARDLDAPAPSERLRSTEDDEYIGIRETSSLKYRTVVEINSLGVDDYYDMHVPGWQNYCSNAIFSHNTIQMVGDLTAMIPGVPPLGGIADAILKPLYTDVFLAFGKIRSQQRAYELGGSHLHEKFAEGGDRAYTLAWLLAMRTAMWETRQQTSHTVVVADGAPYRIGQRGHGHFWLGDRVGSTVRGMEDGYVFVDRVSELNLAWDRDTTAEWAITIGVREVKDPVVKAFEKLQEVLSILKDLGVI